MSIYLISQWLKTLLTQKEEINNIFTNTNEAMEKARLHSYNS